MVVFSPDLAPLYHLAGDCVAELSWTSPSSEASRMCTRLVQELGGCVRLVHTWYSCSSWGRFMCATNVLFGVGSHMLQMFLLG